MAVVETNVTSSVDMLQLWLASTALNHGIWQTQQEKHPAEPENQDFAVSVSTV